MRAKKTVVHFSYKYFLIPCFSPCAFYVNFSQLFIVQIAFTSETISKSCVESNSDSSAISFNNVLILLRFI